MKTVILIPARYASARYPGKPLAELTQKDGSRKSLIQMSWEAARQIAGAAAGIDHGAVVLAVTGRLDDHIARKPEEIPQLVKLVLAGVAGRVFALRRKGKLR